MKPSLVVLAAVVVVVGVSAPSRGVAPRASSAVLAKLPPATRPGEVVLYGHIKSLARKGPHFEMRFDPAWWLGGVTAQRAAVADGVIRPGEAVPNDYYIRDEDHRVLIYRVPTAADATVLNKRIQPTSINVSELAQVVKGRNPKRRSLFDRGNNLGFWIRAASDTVRSLDQQYQP